MYSTEQKYVYLYIIYIEIKRAHFGILQADSFSAILACHFEKRMKEGGRKEEGRRKAGGGKEEGRRKEASL